MTRTQSRILKFILSCPGATVEEIADHFHVTRAAASAQLKVLRESEFIEYDHPSFRKPARYTVQKARIKECFDPLTDPSPGMRLGKHCTLRYERDTFEEFQKDVLRDQNPRELRIFDIRSIIHAAVKTDTQLRIVAWSPRFKRLVEETTPDLIGTLESRELKYVAPYGEVSWLGMQSIEPFSWEIADTKEEDGCFGENGIWERIIDTGIVDAYAFRTYTYKHQPIYLEFYFAPQYTFLGYQSIMMNVKDRVLAVKEASTKDAHYVFFHHNLGHPLQRLQTLQEDMEDNIGEQSGELHEWIHRISSIKDQFLSMLGAFPAKPLTDHVDVPVLAQLFDAVDCFQHEGNSRRKSQEIRTSIKYLNENHLNDSKKYLMNTIPSLLYGAFYSFVSNAMMYGRSAEDPSISYRELEGQTQEQPKELEITIADKGCGLSDEVLQSWNDEADKSRGANISDIGRFDGKTLAIMGIKTGGGKVWFSATDSKRHQGLTVTIILPVKEAQTLSTNKELT